MVGHCYAAVGTISRMTAIGAEEKGRESPSVEKQDYLFLLLQSVLDLDHQVPREDLPVALLVFFFHVDDGHFGHWPLVDAL